MARGRMINREITQDKKINLLSCDTSRLAFTWLITFADREGRTHGDPAVVRSMLFPRRDDVTIAQMEQYIREWADMGLIQWYESEDDLYISFPNFDKNQPGLRKNKEAESIIPAPPPLFVLAPAPTPETPELPDETGLAPDEPEIGTELGRTKDGVGADPFRLNGMEWNGMEVAAGAAPPDETPEAYFARLDLERGPQVYSPPKDVNEYKARIVAAVTHGAVVSETLTGQIYDLFGINPNWETTTNRKFLEWLRGRPPGEDLSTFARWWWKYDWRGKKKQAPDLKQIRELWPQAFRVDAKHEEYYAEEW